MLYGDGDGVAFRPLTAIDVCGHEFGHGICQFTAKLAYVADESGALNEGFSDIWGASIEHWAAPNKQTWLMGEEITLISPGYLRSLENPNSSLVNNGTVDTYYGTNWSNSTDISTYTHTNMSVLSHWFYLLSEGGDGWNNGLTSHASMGSGFHWSVAGIGIDEAQRIVYRAESQYLNSSANFAAARNAMITAATDLYGVNSCEVASVTNAWYAVGVGDAYSGTLGMAIQGDNLFCTTSMPYTIPNLPAGATVTWSAAPAGIVTINSPNSDSTTLTHINDGAITLTALINTSCGTATATKTVDVGKPKITKITSQKSGACYGPYQEWTLGAEAASPVSSWHWEVDNPINDGWVIYSPNASSTLVSVTGGGGISVYATNACGTNRNGVTIWSNCQTGLLAYPNPATNEIQVSIPEASGLQPQDKLNKNNQRMYQITISDQMGKMKKQLNYKDGVKKARIDLSGLTKGIYIIRAFDGESRKSIEVVKE